MRSTAVFRALTGDVSPSDLSAAKASSKNVVTALLPYFAHTVVMGFILLNMFIAIVTEAFVRQVEEVDAVDAQQEEEERQEETVLVPSKTADATPVRSRLTGRSVGRVRTTYHQKTEKTQDFWPNGEDEFSQVE